MRVLVCLSFLLARSCAEADPYYGGVAYGAYGSAALSYPYVYSNGFSAPHTFGYAAPTAYGYAAAPAVHADAAYAPAVHAATAFDYVHGAASYAPVAHAAAAYAPAVHAAAAYAPAVHASTAPVITKVANLIAAPVAEVHSEFHSSVPSVTSSQFHSQDEEGNYAFGYNNINSARQESGNVETGVSGSYSDGFMTYNYVADDFGFRHV